MKDYEFIDCHDNYFKRISKRLAQVKLANGEEIALCPHKLRPGFPFTPHVSISQARLDAENTTFEKFIRNVEFYNCSYEAGYYLSYWAMKP